MSKIPKHDWRWDQVNLKAPGPWRTFSYQSAPKGGTWQQGATLENIKCWVCAHCHGFDLNSPRSKMPVARSFIGGQTCREYAATWVLEYVHES